MSIDNVLDNTPRVQYVAATSQVDFDYPFAIFQDADLVVDVDGVTKTLTTDYTVTGEGEDTGGTVTFLVAPGNGAIVTIYRDIAIERTSDFQQSGPWSSTTTNDELDRITMILQQLESRIGRSLRLPITGAASNTQTELSPIANWLSKYITINASGVPEPATLVSGTISQSIIAALLQPQTQTETDAGVTAVNLQYIEGTVDRYATNAVPGTTDMTAAIQAAVNVAHAKGIGGDVYFLPATYRTTSAIVYPLQSTRIFLHGNGAVMDCDHNGNGIDWIVTNENYSGHIIEKLTINGPNDFLPTTPGYVPPSTGSAINMNRNATTNAVTAYNNVIRDCLLQGFSNGVNMQAVIGLKMFSTTLQFNQYGIYIDGGQTNANYFSGCHIRSNRKNGIRSQGTTGGSLSNATKNVFHGCLIESNVPYVEGATPSGGTPPTDSTGIYLNNSYNFVFDGCYSENHSASIYLSGGSKWNKFINHVINPGTGRLDAVYLDGAGVYSNEFEILVHSTSLTEVNVISNNANQLYNEFRGTGLNFVSGSVLGKLDYCDIKPSQQFSNDKGYGLIRMPSQGYSSDVNSGTDPGQINGIGTATATLNVRGLGEITLGSGITGTTTITSITGHVPHQFIVIRNAQASFVVTIDSGTVNGDIGLQTGQDVRFTTSGQTLLLYVTGDGVIKEVGRNFSEGITAQASYNPNSLADGAGETTTVGCTGAAMGDGVVVSFSLDLQGVMMTAWVSAADTVSVRFQNETGGVVDLATGIIKVKCVRIT
jgi:hypothetical protein